MGAVDAAGRAPALVAGALDRAAARARRRHVRGAREHVGVAQGVGGSQLRGAADARSARLARGRQLRARRCAARRARRPARARPGDRRGGAAGGAGAGRRLARRAYDHRAGPARRRARRGWRGRAARGARTGAARRRCGRAGLRAGVPLRQALRAPGVRDDSADGRPGAALRRAGAGAGVLHRHRPRERTSAPRRASPSSSFRSKPRRRSAATPDR